jgi:hypothetical protein
VGLQQEPLLQLLVEVDGHQVLYDVKGLAHGILIDAVQHMAVFLNLSLMALRPISPISLKSM